MPKLVRQVTIDASKEKVWEVLADFSGVANWAPTISESRSTTEANGGVGAERTCKHVKMGNIEERIVAWEDGRSLSYDVIKGLPFPMKSINNTWSVNAAGDNAIVSVATDFRMGLGPLGVLPALMARLPMRKEMQVSLAGLKQYVERREVVTTTTGLTPTSLAAATMAGKGSGFALAFLVGGIVGTVVGILIAPQSGAVTRADLAERREAWRRRSEDLRARVSPVVGAVRDRMGRGQTTEGAEAAEATEEAADEPKDPQEG